MICAVLTNSVSWERQCVALVLFFFCLTNIFCEQSNSIRFLNFLKRNWDCEYFNGS